MNRDGKYGTIEMAIKPTAEQKKKLRSFINAVGGNVDIDFMDENYNTTHSVSYEGVSPARALSGITTFYDKGIKPKGNESYSISRDEVASLAESEGTVSYSIVRDEAKIAELEASPKRIGYRNMVLNEDGTLSAPMASSLSYPSRKKETEVKMSVSELGKWEQADEHPELVNEEGKITIYQPENGAGTLVAYDPYIHSRQDRVNTQLKGAWRRKDLVYVEVEIPITDLESGYHADKALKPVGAHEWSGGSGIVMLSMYDKPIRIADWNDVADDWMKRFGNEPIHFDIIPPQLLPILAERGANISSPHPKLGADVYKAYDKFKAEQGVSYSLSMSNKSATRYDKVNGTNVLDFFEFLRNGKVFEKGKPNLFYIANAGELLQQYGIRGKFIVGQFTFSRTHTDNEDHQLGIKEWVDVINNINRPLAIASYKGLPNKFRIYTYATINDKNICLGVDVSLSDNTIALSNVISAYGRDINLLLGKESINLLYPNSIEELKQMILQVSTAHNSLLNAPSSASADKDTTSDTKNQISEQESFSLNRDEIAIATPEMVAEANEELSRETTLVEQLDEAQTALDRLRSKIDKRNQRKEMTFDEVRKFLLDDYFRLFFKFSFLIFN